MSDALRADIDGQVAAVELACRACLSRATFLRPAHAEAWAATHTAPTVAAVTIGLRLNGGPSRLVTVHV